jgi:predicted TIM-barrel fold metal-dependent hydrolase
MISDSSVNRRAFLATSAVAGVALASNSFAAADVPVVDIHQHPGFKGRPGDKMYAHQRAMGMSISFVLPAGTPTKSASTHDGKSNGLAAGCSSVDAAYELFQKHPKDLRFFANEVPDIPEAKRNLEKYLKLGAIGIGEQKFGLEIDSKPMLQIYDIANEFQVPVLMHFQHGKYNHGIERMPQILKRYPKVNFIGHAQTFWGNIDSQHEQAAMYPKGKVVAGGISDQLLSDFPNMYGDHAAGSGLNALLRDEEHAMGFLERHQNKLMFGSDCYDVLGRGPSCRGANMLKALHPVRKRAEVVPDWLISRIRIAGRRRAVSG